MYNYIIGKLVEIAENRIVVETDGIGFDIFFPSSNIESLPNIGTEVKIYTFMNVKEDEMSLYGFLRKEDKEMFLKLITVNGVGPKGALNIISTLGFSALIKALATNDTKTLAGVKGLGQKTASKICIELGDIDKNMLKNNTYSKVQEEVIEALKKLGYKDTKAREMIAKVKDIEGMSTSELLKLALK